MLRIALPVVLLLSVYVSLATRLGAAESTDPRPLPTEGEVKILAALAEVTSADFQESPLSEVIEVLEKKHNIEIQLDSKALEETGASTDTPVTMRPTGISLRSLLRILFGELDLTYVVRDGYLLVTSKTEAENMLRVKVYPVRDLVTADGEFAPILPKDRLGDEDYTSLIELITSTVSPTTWDEVGGPGAIKHFRKSHSITFAQTQEVHEDAAELLAALRRARDVQVAAAKAIPNAAQPQLGNDDGLYTVIYRILPSPNALRFGFGGLGMSGLGGGGMGGGMFRLAEEKASGDPTQNPAAPPVPVAVPPAPAPAAAPPPKAPEATTQPLSQAGTIVWDQRLLDQWSNELARALPRLVASDSWGPGGGSIQVLAGAIVVRQKRDVQKRVEDFLAEVLPGSVVTSAAAPLVAARLPSPGPQLDWPKVVDTSTAPNHGRIEKALDKTCDVDFHEQPLTEAIEALGAQGRIQIWLDKKALEEGGISTDTPVTRSICSVSLRTAFRLVLGDLDLTYVVRDEVLRITSKTEAENMPVTKVYPVFDLIASVPSEIRPAASPAFHVVGMPTNNWRSSDFASLIENITADIAPTTWGEVGGPGAIKGYGNSGALVISQTNEVHEEIATYLQALREAAVVQQ